MTTQHAVLPARSGRSYTGDVFTVASPDTVVTGNTITITERTNAKGLYLVSIVRGSALPAGDYIIVLNQGTLGAAIGYFTFEGTDGETATETPATAALDSDARVRLASDQPDYHPATTAELEARTILAANYRQNITIRGTSMTEAKAFDLLLASLAGVTSQPSGTTEKFKFLDGNDAFTTTFDTNGNRTGVALA